ncbi:hypothetical protein IWW45_008012 [Coemansia sp. RSA 485]|nr:hypothetical protein IWW45_008012 [Coemansia sp. RSA 485]
MPECTATARNISGAAPKRSMPSVVVMTSPERTVAAAFKPSVASPVKFLASDQAFGATTASVAPKHTTPTVTVMMSPERIVAAAFADAAHKNAVVDSIRFLVPVHAIDAVEASATHKRIMPTIVAMTLPEHIVAAALAGAAPKHALVTLAKPLTAKRSAVAAETGAVLKHTTPSFLKQLSPRLAFSVGHSSSFASASPRSTLPAQRAKQPTGFRALRPHQPDSGEHSCYSRRSKQKTGLEKRSSKPATTFSTPRTVARETCSPSAVLKTSTGTSKQNSEEFTLRQRCCTACMTKELARRARARANVMPLKPPKVGRAWQKYLLTTTTPIPFNFHESRVCPGRCEACRAKAGDKEKRL